MMSFPHGYHVGSRDLSKCPWSNTWFYEEQGQLSAQEAPMKFEPGGEICPRNWSSSRTKRFNSKRQLTLHCLVGLDEFSWLRGVSDLSTAVIILIHRSRANTLFQTISYETLLRTLPPQIRRLTGIAQGIDSHQSFILYIMSCSCPCSDFVVLRLASIQIGWF